MDPYFQNFSMFRIWDEIDLTYLPYEKGFRYELNNCHIDQRIREIIWHCRCIPAFANYGNKEYRKYIPFCSGRKLYCAKMRLQNITSHHNVAEYLESPKKIGNISKPDKINCLPNCKVQENIIEMSFAPYPQSAQSRICFSLTLARTYLYRYS